MGTSSGRSNGRRFVAVCLGGLLAVACSGGDITYDSPKTKSEHKAAQTMRQGGIFGDAGLDIFGGGDSGGGGGAGVAIPVNSYLWRATLDTVSFMPLASADPFGGVIITDWFMPPESRGERFKMTVYILSRELRADGLKVAVFRQLRDTTGNWVDGPVSASTASQLENAILTRAREMRIAGIAQ